MSPITTRPGSVPGGRPWSGVTAPAKPKKKKKYPAPKGYVGGWRFDPGLSKKKYKTVKTGKGYYIAKPIRPKGPKGTVTGGTPKPPAPPAPPPGPYDQYKTTAPWAVGMFEDLDRREAAHTGYVTGQVMPWLSAGLQGLTGVNPAAPGYNPQIQQQYLANVQGQVGGALSTAAAAVPGAVAPTTPGASTAAPNAYLGAAMREYSAQRGGAAIMGAQAQAALNTLQPNIYAQSALRSIADYAAGLPAIYVTKRNELRMKTEEFIEGVRHAKVMESIGAMTAQGNLAISMGNLGIRGAETAADIRMSQAEADRKAAEANAAGVKPAPAEGYVVVKEGGVWKYKRDPTVPQASATPSGGSTTDGGTSTRDAQGRLLVPSLEEKGYRRMGVPGSAAKPRAPAGWKIVKGADGRWWVLKPGAGKAPKPAKVRTTQDLSEEVEDLHTGPHGWEEQYPQDPLGAGKALALWVRKEKPSFITTGRVVDFEKLNRVLGVVGGGPRKEARRILMGYMKKVNGRWVWK